MKFERCAFANFRCFRQYELSFKPAVNLLFGANGCGKTTVLKGLKIAMSSFFSGFSDENTRFIGFSNEDFMNEMEDGVKSLERPVGIDYDLTGHSGLSLVRSSKKNRTSIVGIKHFRDETRSLYAYLSTKDDGSRDLPLFAAFSTEDIHSSRKLNKSIFSKYYQPRSFGYYECLQGDGFFDYWMHRLLVLQEGQKSMDEIRVVEDAIAKALGGLGCNIIKSISIRPIQKKVYFVYQDGREVEAGNLSDGYKRLANIVTDLAFRCYLLNGKKYGLACCQFTSGIVLIDEIDQHLHPELQSVVLKSLHNAFPNFQFVVSSHAPMVMSSVMSDAENEVLYLQYQDGEYTATPITTYGMDASTILENYMGSKIRVAEVQDQLDKLSSLIDNEKFEEAKKELASLRELYSDTLPELAHAESILSFWEE